MKQVISFEFTVISFGYIICKYELKVFISQSLEKLCILSVGHYIDRYCPVWIKKNNLIH